MSAQDNGGPAFPRDGGESVGNEGMTLRDWFAGQFMEQASALASGKDGEFDPVAASHACYEYADAMLKARKL